MKQEAGELRSREGSVLLRLLLAGRNDTTEETCSLSFQQQKVTYAVLDWIGLVSAIPVASATQQQLHYGFEQVFHRKDPKIQSKRYEQTLSRLSPDRHRPNPVCNNRGETQQVQSTANCNA
jgi:hypothetical protein